MSKEDLPIADSSDYYRGFHDGFKAAQKAQDYPKIYPTQPLTRTEDLMWPDRMPRCGVCKIDMSRAMGYVCHHPNCPTKVTCEVRDTTSNWGPKT